jgi:hypothetical protein
MMKAEMDDAFRLRKSVMVFMIVVGVGSAVFAGAVVRWVVGAVLLWRRTTPVDTAPVYTTGSGARMSCEGLLEELEYRIWGLLDWAFGR